ncbi:MAG: beta-N-acetylhexosaminidase [Alistipes sp.]|nr:beta-N-acetylhexosaminidase [Candidatus Alistipes equi]
MKMLKKIFFVFLSTIAFQSAVASNFIPQPEQVNWLKGSFTLGKDALLYVDGNFSELSEYIARYVPFKNSTDLSLASIRILRDASLKEEAYSLNVSKEGIVLLASSYSGAFNAVQTFFQMLPAKVYCGELTFPCDVKCVEINDSPRFGYRGFLLDVARTFIPFERIKNLVDLMSYIKVNKLHLHLTDDEAWRVEIKSHPDFVQRAAFRGGDSELAPIYGKFDEKWGGYYTQEQLIELVKYASQRNVEIIPEIDMPGHSKALGTIHPEIRCNFKPDCSRSNGTDIRKLWCVSKPSNYLLIEDIIRELTAIFPSSYFHIGGDEVVAEDWTLCPDCQKTMRKNSYHSVRELEDYFIARVSDILKKYNRKPCVWNEAVARQKPEKTCLVYSWQTLSKTNDVLLDGYQTIVMPGQFFYFDQKQSSTELGHKWAGISDVKNVLSFDFSKLKNPSNVCGLECAFWSELYVDFNPEKPDYQEYMLFPRMCALSELAWTTNKRSWDEFKHALYVSHYDRMDAQKVHYRLQPPCVNSVDGKLNVTCEDDGSKLYYRYDNTPWIPVNDVKISSLDADNVVFRTIRGNATSPEIRGKALVYKTPKIKITSSMPPLDKDKGFSSAENYNGGFSKTYRAARAGDWVEYSFESPLVCRSISLQTGHDHLRRCLFLKGRFQVKYQGKPWRDVCSLIQGAAFFNPQYPVEALRVISDSESDKEDNIVINAPKIL